MSNTTITPVININQTFSDEFALVVYQVADDATAADVQKIDRLAAQIYDPKARAQLLDALAGAVATATRAGALYGHAYGRAGKNILDEG